ncbi:SDR family NAD(P)-dependent oxidoreductase [Amycolatopsis sp. NPDC058986]|uniref:SDR family NAD(P)-dependent oxidoreductase n=1 Tax=unclassified Amycolatopsis TaxID=2618356 RepID=UPI0036717ACB
MKNAVVTGASRGIGLAVVRELVAAGYRVVAGARTVSEELKAATPLALSVDLASPDGPDRLIRHALAELGGIDLLVNNVGGGGTRPGGFLSVSDDEWQRTLDLTLFSTIRATRAALPGMLERRGQVVNIGSVNARLPGVAVLDYSAAKAALVNLGKSLAEEFGPRGVRINTISPGPVRTEVWTAPGSVGGHLAVQAGVPIGELVERMPELMGSSTGRFTEPEEIGALVVFLASGKAPNISGSDLVIDGGMVKTV